MFVARFSIIFCFLSIAVIVFAGSFSNRDLNELSKKITERRQKVTSIDSRYAISAADAWLTATRTEYDHGSNSIAEIAWQQTSSIFKSFDSNNLPLKSVETENSNLRVKEDLWFFVDDTKKSSRYNLVVDDVARLEVTLAWAALKTWESGWKSATSLVNDAQKKSDEIKKILNTPEKPINLPVTQQVSQTNQPAAIINKQQATLIIPSDITLELTGRSGTPIFPGTALIIGDNADKFKISNDAPDKFILGTTNITWKAVGQSGKVLTAIQKITIVDTTPPTIVIPADMTIEMTSLDGMEINIGTAMAIDIADPSPKISNNAPKLFSPGTTIVTWTTQDYTGNIATAGQKVTLVDSIPPVLKAPEDITVEATDPAGTIINIGPAKAIDNLDPIPQVTTDAPDKFQLGTTVVHWNAIDKYGNKSRVNQKVIVTDITKPELTVPADIVTDAIISDDTEVDIGTAKVRDNADASPVVSNDAPAKFSLGETLITWTAKDASGNVNTATQKVVILDKKAPVISGLTDISAETVSATGTVISLGVPVVTDNIDKQPVIKNDAPTSFKPGSYIVTWTATDKSGNQSKSIQKVTITDTTPPRLLPPPDVNIEAISIGKMKINIGTPEVADNADVSPRVANDAPPLFPLGTTIVTWLAIDSSGNRSMATQRVKIIDNIPPSIIPPKDIIMNETSSKGTLVDLGKPVVHDNIDIPKVSNNAPHLFLPGKHEVTWIAIDSAGNSTTAIQKVEILKSNNKPELPKKIIANIEKDSPKQTVFLPYSVHFAPNSIELSTKTVTVINSMVQTLCKYTDIRVMIVGCADSSGDLHLNQKIAIERSNVVADYLVRNGISYERLMIDNKIIQTDGSTLAGSKARETRFFYSSPSIKIKVVDQTTDIVIVESKKSNIKKIVKPVKKENIKQNVKPIEKHTAKKTDSNSGNKLIKKPKNIIKNKNPKKKQVKIFI